MSEDIKKKVVANIKAEGSDDYNDADIMFAKEMIKHHKMALVMSKDVLAKGYNVWISKLAKDIIASQSEQINELEKFLSTRM